MFDFLKKSNENEAEEVVKPAADDVEQEDAAMFEQSVETSENELLSDKVCDLVDFVVSSIIDYPDELELEVTDSPHATLIEIRANPEDCGKIIGKQGNTIKSLRTLARALGSRLGLSVEIQILD